MKKCWVIGCALLFAACENNSSSVSSDNASTPIAQVMPMNYSVLNIYPHDTTSFTEGLLFFDNELYEGTGMYKESRLLKVNLSSGKAIQQVKLAPQYFGEGICILNKKIYQLTYQEHKVFVYDMQFRKLPQEFEWPYEGWGMTTNGTQLIINSGGSNLYFVNPETFKIEKTVGVSDNNGYVDNINEMEWVDGFIYANKYLTDFILKINPETGQVVARADLSGILGKNNITPSSKTEVLNGIAYHPQKKTFFVTGKYWPALFEIRMQ
ncbi:MAG: glutaminyl-peptide cyclotransferase [Chitinophagia bacterium]|jgi:glutamine cyclotransferase